ncbi:hypothetical protein CSC81_08210 [Tenacibaculum discolor]|uniref:DUF1735 domain-containing protein n=2 Tax=Tenacibaculum TaxID=104267 RepID=A0A2G1BUM9_9FLAO|nr:MULTISPECIES: hypothetical protein [Tenacibaculum]MDE1206075.1 hypothetical protein [Tenacibaculum larymnensis]MDP2542027.1 hypothetical protein [Tenacibaculum discolor]PHN97559.1 hypothetical protein CSC81_08210 [Tenacibaculum discolor]PHN99442.1 hypothetical protein CSC82_33995 [Rhodobacteraceae bacterium 4F10]
MKKILKYLTVLFIALSFTNCEDSNEPININYVGFEAINAKYSFGVEIDSETTKSINIHSTKSSSSDRTFNITVLESSTADPNSYSIPNSITIPSGEKSGSMNVTIKDLNISPTGEKIFVRLDATEGTYVGETMEINVYQVCSLNEVILNIEFDDYPEEVYWNLKDSNGTILYESVTPSAFGAYDGMEGNYTQSLCLQDGDYTFSMLDGYGDGAGAYSLTYNGNTIKESDGDYGEGESTAFTVPN